MGLALNCRVDHKSRICVLQCFSSVPARFVGRPIVVYAGAEVVEAREAGRVVARRERAVGKGTERLWFDHYLKVLDKKPGALAGAGRGQTQMATSRAADRVSLAPKGSRAVPAGKRFHLEAIHVGLARFEAEPDVEPVGPLATGPRGEVDRLRPFGFGPGQGSHHQGFSRPRAAGRLVAHPV